MTLTRNYQNRSEMERDGWTAADFDALKTATRSRAGGIVDGKFVWPQVNGFNILYSLFTDAEKKAYNTVYSRGKGTSGSPASMDEDTKAKWLALLEANKDDPVAKALVYELCPLYKTSDPIYQLFGAFELPEEPVSVTWVMYRQKGGRFENTSIDRRGVLSAAIDDETIEQVLTLDQVKELIAKVDGAADKVLM